MHRMTAPIALFENTKKVPLEATVGEILIQAKRELHGCSDGLQCYLRLPILPVPGFRSLFGALPLKRR